MALYPEEVIEEVKNSSDVYSVISYYVNLKRRGNTYVGLCPFHSEKTPSFAVNPNKQIFHCFGCGVGGNVITFIMKIENLGFKEAVEFLAEKANITLPTIDYYNMEISQDELKKREEDKKEMYAINKVAGRFFYDNIEKSSMAREYIAKRKIDAKTVAKYGLGFSLDDNGLTKCLKEKGFKEENMIATGLVGRSEKGFLYDKFKNRFMFPIFDVQKRLVAFGGRTLEPSDVIKAKGIPKYVNSPENLIYTKGKHLYGLNVAKTGASGKLKKILVVEGYMDVISPHQAGITNVVASLGTALTEQQGRLLRSYADEVVLSYDSDEAGQKAILRGIDIMQALNVPIKVLKMSGAKDPDEYVIKYGGDKFNFLIDNSVSPAEYKVDLLKKKYNLNDTSDKITFLTKMAEVLSKVENVIERDVYVEKFSKELNVGKEAIIAEIEKRTIRNNFKTKNWQSSKPISNDIENIVKVENRASEDEKLIIYLLTLKNDEIFQNLKEIYTDTDISKLKYSNMIKKLYNLYENGNIINIDLMSVCETDEENSFLTEILMKDNVKDDDYKSALELVRSLEINKLQEEKKEITEKLGHGKTEDEERFLLARLDDIIKKLAKK